MHNMELDEEIELIYKRIYTETDINTVIVSLTCPSLKLTFSFSIRNFELELRNIELISYFAAVSKQLSLSSQCTMQ